MSILSMFNTLCQKYWGTQNIFFVLNLLKMALKFKRVLFISLANHEHIINPLIPVGNKKVTHT